MSGIGRRRGARIEFISMRRCGARAAFTLVEMTIVLGVLAIVCGIGVPRFMGVIQNRRALFAAQRVAADLSMAQARANMGSTTVTVSFEVGTGRYKIPGVTDMNSGAGTYAADIGADPYFARVSVAMIGSRSDVSGTSSISFNGFGSPSAGAVLTITAGTSTRTVTVDAASGRATAQ